MQYKRRQAENRVREQRKWSLQLEAVMDEAREAHTKEMRIAAAKVRAAQMAEDADEEARRSAGTGSPYASPYASPGSSLHGGDAFSAGAFSNGRSERDSDRQSMLGDHRRNSRSLSGRPVSHV